MLQDSLYKIDSYRISEGKVETAIVIDVNHKIFEGHFPGQPVLPGVCMIQIIKELTEKATGKRLFLSAAGSCKFLSMIDPAKTSQLNVIINYISYNGNEFKVNAMLKTEEMIFLKMQGTFKEA